MPSTTDFKPQSPGGIKALESSEDRNRFALRCRQLAKSYGEQPVVDNVTFSVLPGDILVLLGPSGCGKTTTLRLIAGFEQLDGGSIEIGGRIVAGEDADLPPEKRRVGMVFQDYAVFPHLSVGRNVGFALGKSREAQHRIAELLDFVGLPGREAKMPHELSGGEQQRVSLARALSVEPAVLLLDEPFSNLDAALRADVRLEVRTLLKQSGITAVFVTHDQEEALFLGDMVGVMRAGQLEQLDAPETIYHQPQTRFVAEFIGQTDFISGEAVRGGVLTPIGFLARAGMLPEGTAVEVALRPEHVKLQPEVDGSGRVKSRQFTGMSYIYRVALPNGMSVRSRQPYAVQLAEGTPVNLSLAEEYEPPCFYKGKAL